MPLYKFWLSTLHLTSCLLAVKLLIYSLNENIIRAPASPAKYFWHAGTKRASLSLSQLQADVISASLSSWPTSFA